MQKTSMTNNKKRNALDQRDSMRKSILIAFEELLKEAPYSEIGVNRICTVAHISKPTFYRYFQSKEEIVCWLSKEAVRCGVAEVGRKYNWHQAYYRTLKVIDRYRGFYTDPKGPAFTNPYNTFCGEYFKLMLFETLTQHKGIIITKKLSFQIDTFVQMQGYLLQQWGAREMPITEEVYAEHLTSVVPHDLYLALAEPTDFVIRQR